MTQLSKDEQPSRLTLAQKKAILERLYQKKKKVKEIATEFNTNEKAIFRVRKEALGYLPEMRATLPKHIRDYLILYGQERKKISNLVNKSGSKSLVTDDAHADALANCAKELVTRLNTYKEELENDDFPKEFVIQEVVEGLELDSDFDDIELFNKKIAQGLLAHLSQSDFCPELKGLRSWFELEVGKISENLLKMIRLVAALRRFEGKCELCQ